MNNDQNFNQYQNSYQQEGRPMEPHRGTMILIFGIVGILLCGIFAILAWVFGNQDLKKMREGIMDPRGESNTNIGRILGIIGVCLWIAGILVYALFLGAIVGTAGSW